MSEQLTSVEHITLTPELASLVQDFGLDFAMAFQVLRPRLQAELERAREEDKAAVQKRLLAEKQALEARNNSPTKEATPLPGTPAAEAMEVDGGEGQEVVLEESKDGEEVPKTAEILTVPPPKSALVSCPVVPGAAALTRYRPVQRSGGPRLSRRPCNRPGLCYRKMRTMS